MAEIPIEKLSPMLRQYMELKAERPEVILLIRVGDFFEAYGVDATLIAAALDITLTGRDVNGMEERLPMAGVPYHALDRYLARLVQQGHKVAICDQIEDPKQAKGLVRRAITRVVTPGTLVEDALLDARSNNFLVAAILRTPISWSVSFRLVQQKLPSLPKSPASHRLSVWFLKIRMLSRMPSRHAAPQP
jgi:DNA mismatch repair protein MutS